jgi:hypothetical protein
MSDQFIVTAIIRPTTVGTETLSFSFNLGPLKVVCIGNIPADGEGDKSTAYIHLQLPDENGDYPTKHSRRRSPPPNRLEEQANDHIAYGHSSLDDDGVG